jgi:hypothetical protein
MFKLFKPKYKPETYVARYDGDNEEAIAELTFGDKHEDGIYEHTNVELSLTVGSDDCGLPVFWEIHWFHTLSYLQAILPEYIAEHCPHPVAAAEVLGMLGTPEYGILFRANWGEPANDTDDADDAVPPSPGSNGSSPF